MYTAQRGLKQPLAIRYPRGRGRIIDWNQPFEKIEIGTGIELKKGNNIAVLSIGTISKNIETAIKNCNDESAIAHYDLRFVKPLDTVLLHNIFKTHSHIITIEDNVIAGGFGTAIIEFAVSNQYKNSVEILGVPDTFIEHGSIIELQKSIKLDADSLKLKLNNLLKKKESN
jgi:1-deoxy-D-xylulose-5-phosphate synthase